MRVRRMLFLLIVLMLLHSANVMLRASTAGLAVEQRQPAATTGSADGRDRRESARSKKQAYASGDERLMSQREKVAMWLERVAAGAASIPPHLLGVEEVKSLTQRSRDGQQEAGSSALKSPSAAQLVGKATRTRSRAGADGDRGVHSPEGNPRDHPGGMVPISLQRLRAIANRVDAEEAALSNASVIWPRVFIIGAPKAASSMLSRLLSYHQASVCA